MNLKMKYIILLITIIIMVLLKVLKIIAFGFSHLEDLKLESWYVKD